MLTIDQWLKNFLSDRGLSSPDRRPLYAYRCDDAEFEELQAQLTVGFSGLTLSRLSDRTITCQAFCLWAAEWWRRNHDGGPWRWEDMLVAIGAEFLAPGNSGYQRLCAAVGTGLKRWERPILQTGNGRAFLVTLACEGGLPLRLVTREQAGLRRYFKAVLEDIRALGAASIPVEQIAERSAAHLSRRLRHDVVFTLCGKLAAKVWELQKVLDPTPTPLADLDRVRPGWRDDLPLRIEDSVAAALLNNLLVEASAIARRASGRMRWARYLVRRGDEWDLEGELELPNSLPEREFSAIFSPPGGDVPRRFDLCVQAGDGTAEVMALGTSGHGGETPALRLEHARAASRRVHGVAAAATRRLVVRDGVRQLATDQFSGAAELSELPWVFEAPLDPGQTAEVRLAGEGTTSVKTAAALVAAPPGAVLTPYEGAEVAPAGSLRDLARSVYRVTGSASCRLLDGATVVIRTGDISGRGEVEYRLGAARHLAARTPEPVFLGIPRLLELRDGSAPVTVPTNQLQWKSEGGVAGWVGLSASAIGDGRIRYVEGGQLRFSSRVKLLPEAATVRFLPDETPDRGVIELQGFRDRDVIHVAPGAETAVALRRLPGEGVRLELSSTGAAPPTVTLSIMWAQGPRLSLTLPFPACGSGFQDRQGGTLASGALVSLAMLPGIRATAMVPRQGAAFTLEGTYTGTDAAEVGASRTRLRVPVAETAPGSFELDLGIVRSWVAARLDASSDEDGSVRLEVLSNRTAGVSTRTLRVARYDVTLMLAVEENVVRLPAESLVRLNPEEVESFRVEAFPLLQPDQPRIPLERVSNVTWLLPRVPADSGPWMIVGWQGDWCRARPCRWNPGRLAHAAVEGPDDTASNTVASTVQAMAVNTSHSGWLVVDGLINWTRHLPPVSFVRLRALAENPSAMAVAALRLPEALFDRFWPEMETLPFSWQLVPRSAWDSAVATVIQSFRTEMAALGEAASFLDPEAMLREQLDRGIGRVIQRMRGLAPVLGMARARVLGEKLTVRETAMLRPEIRGHFLHERRQLLEQSGADTGDLTDVPKLSEIEGLCRSLPAHPDLEPLWIRKGLEPTHQRFSIANAPVIAALAALAGVRLTRLQLCELRGIRDRAPEWFDDSYHACYLYALGVLQSARTLDALRGAPPVLSAAR